MDNSKNLRTRKKVKVIGTQEYVDTCTGEVKQFQVIDIEERDANFHKLWLGHVINSLDLIGNQKTKLAFWLLDQMDSENKVCMTLRQMATASKISLETVRVTIKALMDSDFLIRHNQGVYLINPDMLFKGGQSRRMNVLLSYHNSARSDENSTNKVDEDAEHFNHQDEPDPVDQLEQLPDNARMAGVMVDDEGIPLPTDDDYTESEEEPDDDEEEPPQATHKHICPKCGREMVLKHGKRGAFWGCTGYPGNCTYTENFVESTSSAS